MSENPGWDLPESAIRVQSWHTGGHDAFADGLRHRKRAPATIVAIAERGRYAVRRDGGPVVEAKPGEAFLAQEGEWIDIVHHADRAGGTMAAVWVHFHVSVFATQDACKLLRFPPILPTAASAGVRAQIVATGSTSPGVAGSIHRAAAALSVLRIVMQASQPDPEAITRVHRAASLATLAAWVEARLDQSIHLDDLAAVAGLSKSRLHARFQADFGCAPMAWVRELRLLAARDRLLAGEDPVAAIGEACGFPDPFHFSRLIKARFGASPSQVRASRL